MPVTVADSRPDVSDAAEVAERLPRRRRRDRGIARFVLFAGPGVLVYGLLVLGPMILGFVYSLTDRNLLLPDASWVGTANYRRLFSDPDFWRTFGFTTLLTAFLVIVPNATGLALAVLLDRVGRYFFALRMLFFVPVVLSGVIVAFLWATILTNEGLLNSILRSVGLDALALNWLGESLTAQLSVMVVTSWQAVGLCVVIYLAGLQTVPRELLDAARTDGAGPWSSFRFVTWPMLAPAVTINSTLLLINGFKTYDIPLVLNGTGPAGATRTVATEVIRVGFTVNRAGLASAMAIVLLIVVAVVAAVMLRALQSREVAA